MSHHLTAICRALDFVEDNLKEEITVADMADAAAYSLYHFCRTFNSVVHHTPYNYLMRRRLSESARDLVETDKRIIDIAFDYRFNNPETYSRAFKRMFGVQPHQHRKHGPIDGRFLMSRLTPEHLGHISKGDYLRPVLEEKDAFQVVGVMTLVQSGQEVILGLWHLLAQGVKGVPGAKGYYGLTWYPENWEERGFLYMAAVEMETPDIAGSALVMKTIPPSRYARFIHKGSRGSLGLTRDYIYQTWLPKSGESLAQPLEIESYGHRWDGLNREESEWKVYIPIK